MLQDLTQGSTGKVLVASGGVVLGFVVGLLIKYVKSLRADKEAVKSDTNKEMQTEGKYKVVFAVNSSLKMGKGKIAAQCGHAVLGMYKKARKSAKTELEDWMNSDRDIFIVSVKTEDDFDTLAQVATTESLSYYVVADAGRTQIKEGSLTVMAFTPASVETINRIFGHLPIYL